MRPSTEATYSAVQESDLPKLRSLISKENAWDSKAAMYAAQHQNLALVRYFRDTLGFCYSPRVCSALFDGCCVWEDNVLAEQCWRFDKLAGHHCSKCHAQCFSHSKTYTLMRDNTTLPIDIVRTIYNFACQICRKSSRQWVRLKAKDQVFVKANLVYEFRPPPDSGFSHFSSEDWECAAV